MKTEIFSAKKLKRYLEQYKIATMEDLKNVLGTDVRMTVFGKLEALPHRTSYSHRGKYYALEKTIKFNDKGLWSSKAVWFSLYGTLLETTKRFVDESEMGYAVTELDEVLHVSVKESLINLFNREKVYREKVSSVYIYYAINPNVQAKQIMLRREWQHRSFSSETSEFVVDNIAKWWKFYGKKKYLPFNKILILADSGGANGYISRMWKFKLSELLCNKHDLEVTVCHFPSGASKWNPIEHRLFSEISKNWQDTPLVDYETILKYIKRTKTKKGLKVRAQIVTKEY